MSIDIRTRAVAAFSALTLASLLTTGAAIAASGHKASARGDLSSCLTTYCPHGTAPIQAKPAHLAKASAVIAMRSGRRY
jgi:hypothetical protein